MGGIGVLLLVGLVAGYGWLQYKHVDTDHVTGCPKTGPVSITAVIFDVTDKLGPIQKADIRAFMEDIRDGIPKYGRLDLYTVRKIEQQPLEVQFQSCNPGTGQDVSSLTGNRGIADRTWKKRFGDKLEQVFGQIITSNPGDSSPILESVQSVSVTSFEGPGSRSADKRLILISDLLQYTKRKSFYTGAPKFEAFKATQYYRDVRTELHNVRVTVSIVPRDTRRSVQNSSLLEFWTSYFADEGAVVDKWRPILGSES